MKIELQKWSFEDKETLITICNSIDRSYLAGRIPNPYTEESADWWLNMVGESDGKNAVFRKIVADGKIVGNISVEQKEDVYCKNLEIGYFLLPERCSKGIITEAVKKICEIVFRELDVIRITGRVYEPNIASRKVLEKNDFSLEGVLRNAVFKNGEIYNLYIYGKLAGDRANG